jgi:hypothetical protein
MGVPILSAGSQISWNGSSWGGTTDSFYKAFTQGNNSMGGGELAKWQYPPGVSALNFGPEIASGPYAGLYYINRNDHVGEAAWTNTATGVNQEYHWSDFYDYDHNPVDQRYWIYGNLNNPNDHTLDVSVTGHSGIIQTTLPGASGYYDPYSGAAIYYGDTGMGSGGAYQPSPNTDWSLRLNWSVTTAMGISTTDITILDHHSSATYGYFPGITLSIGAPFFNAGYLATGITIPYQAAIRIEINTF